MMMLVEIDRYDNIKKQHTLDEAQQQQQQQ